MESRPARVARGLVAASLSTYVAAVSHAAGGGVFPHPMLLLTGFVLGVVFCTGVAGRRVTLLRLVPAVAVSQTLFHLLFSTTADSAQVVSRGHGHHLTTVMAVQDSGSAVLVDGGMLAAHVLAGMLTILALRFGEAAFWGLFDTARLMLTALLRFVLLDVVPAALRPAPIPAREFEPAILAPFLMTHPHRGPPTVAVRH